MTDTSTTGCTTTEQGGSAFPEVRPKRLYPGAMAPAVDREAEVMLRAQLAAELADLLGQRSAGETDRNLTSGPGHVPRN